MQRTGRVLVLGTALAMAAPAVAQAQAATDAETMRAVTATALTWTDASVPGFAPGMKMAVIHGNPEVAGSYTLRLSFPDGYKFPAHWHPMTENATVLTGSLQLGMGERVDESSLKAYGAGDYLYIPAKMPHFGGARGYTVIQLHGQGPFTINLVEATRP